jgi:hypothetical protein
MIGQGFEVEPKMVKGPIDIPDDALLRYGWIGLGHLARELNPGGDDHGDKFGSLGRDDRRIRSAGQQAGPKVR